MNRMTQCLMLALLPIITVLPAAASTACGDFPGGTVSGKAPGGTALQTGEQSFNDDVVLPPQKKNNGCQISLSCPQPLGSLTTYIPTVLTPIKTVAVNFHIMQKTDGTGNWTCTPKDLDGLRQLAAWINGYFEMGGCPPTDPCPGADYPPDTKIRISLENIYFYQDDALWAATEAKDLLPVAFKAHPAARRQLNIFITGGVAGASGRTWGPGTDHEYDEAVVMLQAKSSQGDGHYLQYGWSTSIAHELGHAFGLLHTYKESCCPETFDATNCDYLSDVFCPPINPAPQMAGFSCDPTQPPSVNSCTNNMMGGVRDACLFSRQQIGKMHRALSITSAQKYLKPTACTPPPSSLVLWLPFNERSGDSALNALGSPGALIGKPSRPTGKFGASLCFSGSTQYVEVPDYPLLAFGKGSFSLSVWVKVSPGQQNNVVSILDKRTVGTAGYNGFQLFLLNGRPGVQLADGVFSNYAATSSVPADGNFHHVAVTVQRGGRSSGTFYLDGAPVGTFDATARSGSVTNAAPLRVGRASVGAPEGFVGCLGEIEGFSRALLASEVQAIASSGVAGQCEMFCTAPEAAFANAASSVSLTARICNATAAPQALAYWFEGLPAGICSNLDGPDAYTPCSNLVYLFPGTCTDVPTQVARPQSFNGGGQPGCYQVSVQALGMANVYNFSCLGTIRDICLNPPCPNL